MASSEKEWPSGYCVSVPLYTAVTRALIRDRGDRLIDQAGHNELIRLLAEVQEFFDGLPRAGRAR